MWLYTCGQIKIAFIFKNSTIQTFLFQTTSSHIWYKIVRFFYLVIYLSLYIYIFVVVVCLFRAALYHMAVPRLGVQSELQLVTYATATRMQDLSHVCDLHLSSWQHWILNPLCKARDRTHNLMVPSQIHFHCAKMGTPRFIYIKSEFIPLTEIPFLSPNALVQLIITKTLRHYFSVQVTAFPLSFQSLATVLGCLTRTRESPRGNQNAGTLCPWPTQHRSHSSPGEGWG